jgi:bla regulator protein BlaR1
MQALFNQFSQVLGITLLHSLWQGLIIYVLLRIILLCFPKTTSASKCNMALLALAASVLWPLATLLIEINNHPFTKQIIDTDSDSLTFIPLIPTHHTEALNTYSFAINNYLTYLVAAWLIGILLNSAKLLWGWRNLYQLKQGLFSPAAFADSVQKLSQILKINKTVRVFISEHLDVPCIIGYLKPMIILPMAVVTQFSVEQIRSILIHEMAHIRRNDFFINLLQQIVGIFFFFNPFTHLINRLIYTEREHCCDDLVLQITGQPLIYAQTLLKLEESRTQNWQLALAATGKKYYLLNRIKRIMETKKPISNIRHILVAVLLLLGSMGTIAWLNPEIKDSNIMISPVNLSRLIYQLDDTTKATQPKQSATAKSQSQKVKNKSHGIPSNVYGFGDPELDKLSAQVDEHSKALDKYYTSDLFKKLQKDMDSKKAETEAFDNSPEMKRFQLEEEKMGRDFEAKWGETTETKVMNEQMQAAAKKVEQYYNSPEYKQLFTRLEKKYGILPNSTHKKFNDPDENYSKYLDELKKNIPADISDQNEQIKKLGEQMSKRYNSPDFIAQRDQLQTLTDSIKKTLSSREVKQLQQDIKKINERIQAYQNNPEIKKAQQQLQDAEKKLSAYTNSPAFKEHVEEMKKNGKHWYERHEQPEKVEQPEQPEKPEKVEKPEQPEKVEQPEQPEKPEAIEKPESKNN